MQRLQHNLMFAALLGSLAVGCGRFGSKTEVKVIQGYGVPDYLHSPVAVSPVPIGSKDVVSSPPAGLVRGAVLLRLLAEPGAKVFYSFRPFAVDAADAEKTEYKEPLLLLPPVQVFAQAQVGDERGPVRPFAFAYDPQYLVAAPAVTAKRLPPVAPGVVMPGIQGQFTEESAFPSLGLAERLKQTVTVDGKASDWTGQGALTALDGLGDVPVPMAATDLAWAEAGETDDAFYFVLSLAAKPRTAEGFYYGVDLGPSHISLANFGAGTTFTYRLEVTKGALSVTKKDGDAPVTLSAASKAVVGDVVEIVVAKADLPALVGQTDLAARPFALDASSGATVLDRVEPLFMRSRFALNRGLLASPSDDRQWRIDFRESADVQKNAVAGLYLKLGAVIFPELEAINRIPLYARGSIPVYFVNKEENGYSGLNTSDRGLLTTLGANTSAMSKTQILAHEVAHYQNARYAALKPRWLQEGMSEWSAERVLYRHFPARAAHKFLRKLRFDRYFDQLNGKLDEFPLESWTTESTTSGYEKSLMFLDLLEARLGQDAVREAFQLAVNEPMESAGFQSFLEAKSGQDLSGLFSYWMKAGDPAADANPYKLFKDNDGDGLLGLDEETLGTDPGRLDTDGDAFPDGEEYFRGTNPLVADALGSEATDSGAPLRLGFADADAVSYSFDEASPTPEHSYTGPVFYQPPYRLAVRHGAGTVTMLARDLYVAGVKVTPDLAANVILPLAPKQNETLRTDTVGNSGLALSDVSGELPASLAAYDLTGTTLARAGGQMTFHVATRAKPQPFGDDGDVTLTFDNVTWSTTFSPQSARRFALVLSGGAPYWHVYKGDGTETSQLLTAGVSWTYGDDLQIVLDESLVATWLADGNDQRVCVQTEATFAGSFPVVDEGGCLTLASPGFTRRTATAPDEFGLGTATLEVFFDDAQFTEMRASRLLTLGLSAVREFEHVLGRPHLGRSHWASHVFLLTSGSTFGAASVQTGAYIGVPLADAGDRLDYLFVEQLARLVSADYLTAQGKVPPYWTQELFVQWLTSSALSNLIPTHTVHQFHQDRIDDFVCYFDGVFGCGSLFSSDVALANWNAESGSSTGSVKSLLFMLELDARFGAATMAEVLSTYANDYPIADELAARFKAREPDATAEIDALWTRWVTGSAMPATDGNQIRATLDDDDSDGLYLFEEQKLGTSDTVADPYLN